MNYYNPPPTLRTYSTFFKASAVRKATEMVEWADREYEHALNTSIDNQRWGVVKVLAGEWSGMRVLSELQDFHWFCAMLAQDEVAWNKLDRKTRKFICKAMEWYEGMRKTKVN
jgi:hypothetical protein